MNHKKLLLFLIFISIMLPSNFAVMIITSPSQLVDNTVTQTACTPPMDWALTHSCILKYPYADRTVGLFYCEGENLQQYLYTDCNGNVLRYIEKDTQLQNQGAKTAEVMLNYTFLIVTILIISIPVIILILPFLDYLRR